MHHSPSSLSCAGTPLVPGEGCERKWWYEHVERRREPEVTWAQIEAWGKDWQKHCTPKQRSSARGTAVHSVFEEYYEGGSPDWTTYIGQIAVLGRAHLPHREACLEIRVERSIGDTPYPSPRGDEPDRTALILDGVRFLGYVDLEVRMDPDGAEAKRLGISEALRAGDGWYTFDYKTSKAVDRYAITPAKAATDPQGLLYPAAGMIRTNTEARGMRWVYMQTEGRPYAKPVDALVTYDGSKAHLAVLVDRARELEAKTHVDDTTPNPDECPNYAGCPHHITRGGPCTARRAIGRLAVMGFRDQYAAAKAAAPAVTPASVPPVAETAAQTATTVAPPAKAFGKKAAAAPAEAPALLPGPETPVSQDPTPAPPAVVNATPAETPKAKATRARSSELATIGELAANLLERVRVELADGDEKRARTIVQAMVDNRFD